ncbi:MAG: DMT family transporter [Gammaproteobacteria bacterium]
MKESTLGLMAGFAGITVFAFTLPVTRYAVAFLDPLFVGLGRSVLAAMIAGMALWWLKVPLPTNAQFWQLLLVALGVVIGFPLLTAHAMTTVPAVRGGVVVGILPMATAITGSLLTGEKASTGFWLTAVAGCLFVLRFMHPDGFQAMQTGDVFLLCAIMVAALGYALGGRLSIEMGGWQVICWALLIACPLLLIPVSLHAPESFREVPVEAWLCLIYLAIGSQLLGFAFWYRALALGGIVRISQIQLIQPFITFMAATLLLGERLDGRSLVYALLVVGTVAIGRLMPVSRS